MTGVSIGLPQKYFKISLSMTHIGLYKARSSMKLVPINNGSKDLPKNELFCIYWQFLTDKTPTCLNNFMKQVNKIK